MDRASDFGSEGWGFESLRARFLIVRLIQERSEICLNIAIP